MQLGTRWTLGETAPAALPEVVTFAIQTVEQELIADDIETTGWRWTLTWLEGLPIAELDDGTTVRYDPATDAATIVQPFSDE